MKYDNAFYNSAVDTLFFVPYKDTALPIPLNPGVIAHEHFHSYFSYQVLNPLVSEKVIPRLGSSGNYKTQKGTEDLYSLFVLKAINESLADVWGWIYSNDPDFVALSLPKAQNSRNLDRDIERVSSKAEMQSRVNDIIHQCSGAESKCIADASYGFGSPLARGTRAGR